MRNSWGGQLYPRQFDMLCAIAREWISGAGSASATDEIATVTTQTAAELAAECAHAWSLDTARGDSDESHMEAMGYGISDLSEAFATVMPKIKAEAEAYIAERAAEDADDR
jgi:hypothetical protein